MTEEKILTKHPLGKSGKKYQQAELRNTQGGYPFSFAK